MQQSMTMRQMILGVALVALGAMAPSGLRAQEGSLPSAAGVPMDIPAPRAGKITPSFSIAPRSVFRRRGPRGARMESRDLSVFFSANVHDMLPERAARFWPAPLRLSVGRRGFGGTTGETIVGLDLDAAQLPGNHPAWVRTKQLLHSVRLPGPALIIGPGGTRALGLSW